MRAVERDQYRRNPQGKQKSAKRYYDANADACKARVAEYRRAEPEKVRAGIANYRALAGCAGRHTGRERAALLEFFGFRCTRCAEDLLVAGHHIDHIVPLSRGGRNTIDNLRPLCPRCNLSKNKRLDHECWT